MIMPVAEQLQLSFLLYFPGFLVCVFIFMS